MKNKYRAMLYYTLPLVSLFLNSNVYRRVYNCNDKTDRCTIIFKTGDKLNLSSC